MLYFFLGGGGGGEGAEGVHYGNVPVKNNANRFLFLEAD